jgi:hypothetical protein
MYKWQRFYQLLLVEMRPRFELKNESIITEYLQLEAQTMGIEVRFPYINFFLLSLL